ncbi:MAG: single-stranded DNA-binding protein [Candidatus Eisenbacteria bacterium]|nr:single-stranded DNA-binding protein [Candidatus Eisenbacteria bacterium]
MGPAPVNRVQLSARVTREPELRYLPTGVPLARLSLEFEREVRRPNGMLERVPGHVGAVVTGPAALEAHEKLRKGGQVYVEGQLQSHAAAGADGIVRGPVEIRVEELKIVSPGPGPEPELPLDAPQQG